ncbi:hypothetical protein HDU81_001001, partial [Chytriomyces hyalinus]
MDLDPSIDTASYIREHPGECFESYLLHLVNVEAHWKSLRQLEKNASRRKEWERKLQMLTRLRTRGRIWKQLTDVAAAERSRLSVAHEKTADALSNFTHSHADLTAAIVNKQPRGIKRLEPLHPPGEHDLPVEQSHQLPKSHDGVNIENDIMRKFSAAFDTYKATDDHCLSIDSIIDLRRKSFFQKHLLHVDWSSQIKSVTDHVLQHFNINIPKDTDEEYHQASCYAYNNDAKKEFPRISSMDEPEYTPVLLRALLSWPFDQQPKMHWCGSEARLFASSFRKNLHQNHHVDCVQLPHKVDGVVRLLNHDADGYEVLVLEVSGKPFTLDPSKYADDFYKIGREMKDCFSHAIHKIQFMGKSTSAVREKLMTIGIQCHGYHVEVSGFCRLYGRHWIIPLFVRKISPKQVDSLLQGIEAVVLSIKDNFLTLEELFNKVEESNPDGASPTLPGTQTGPTPCKKKKAR